MRASRALLRRRHVLRLVSGLVSGRATIQADQRVEDAVQPSVAVRQRFPDQRGRVRPFPRPRQQIRLVRVEIALGDAQQRAADP